MRARNFVALVQYPIPFPVATARRPCLSSTLDRTAAFLASFTPGWLLVHLLILRLLLTRYIPKDNAQLRPIIMLPTCATQQSSQSKPLHSAQQLLHQQSINVRPHPGACLLESGCASANFK